MYTKLSRKCWKVSSVSKLNIDKVVSKKNCKIVKYTHTYFLKRVVMFLKTGEITRRKLRYELVVVTRCLVLLITQSFN